MTAVALPACGGGGSSDSSDSSGVGGEVKEAAQPDDHSIFDTSWVLGDVQAIRLEADISTSLLRGADISCEFDPFSAFFDEKNSDAVRKYLADRAREFVTFSQFARAVERLEGLAPGTAKQRREKFETPLVEGPRISAVNLGTAVWFNAKVYGLPGPVLDFGDRQITVDSPRAGLIGVPDDYHLHASTPALDRLSRVRQIVRQATLVHEARHSDCPGGLPRETLEQAQAAQSLEKAFTRDTDLRCGQMHIMCVTGDYRGILACDGQPWGSYAAGLLFLTESLARSDLTSEERHVLQVLQKDAIVRLDFDHRAMLRGELGPPDMSHSEAVVDAPRRSIGR